ncbi:hypothetical protein AX774_g7124 [Zancudomyces culisetae]|uniref:Uncharacterized protein n=1 Tax=Zancudomyces culisetae TaxID=1213189 RepID=A0A1R1PEV5_ZANCU|nr:hypothetical protein AX774_g7124 [Zancudomyces culisetae]|eukprot:OMH79459.1 hypothetical protein AX774_g7124 [Zancudomyces culisetae]
MYTDKASFENVKEAIDDLGVFEKFQDIVAYARVPYANEYLLNGKNIPSERGNGCEYPYFKMDSVEHTTHAVGPEDLFVEYKVCTRMDTCSISADTIALSAGEKRDRPIEENCIFSIYAPSRKT